MEIIPFSISEQGLENYLINITSRSRIIYWLIVGIIIFAIAILPFIYIDVSVQARGYFQSEIEKQIVYTPYQGKIIYNSVTNGTHVTKGDTLLIIDSESLKARKNSIIKQIGENEASIKDLEKLTKIDSSENDLSSIGIATQKYRAELADFKTQRTIQLQKYLKKKSEHERNEKLFNQEIIPESDFETSLFILNSENENLNKIILYQKSLWQNDLTNRKNNQVGLWAELEQCSEELSHHIVLAPVSGEIIQTSDIQAESMVSSGQEIAVISPEGALVATCFVKPSDIGLIHDRQKVKIQVDAFNYNEWGMLKGEVIDISDDIIVDNGHEAYFRIKCRPFTTFLFLKNGHKAEIKKGMSVNTRIFIIKRSLFNLLFDKADKWFNPYAFKNEK